MKATIETARNQYALSRYEVSRFICAEQWRDVVTNDKRYKVALKYKKWGALVVALQNIQDEVFYYHQEEQARLRGEFDWNSPNGL